MSIKDTHTAFDALLKEQLSQLNPAVPEGIWEGMEAQLDQINQSLQFDASIRESVNQINIPAPQDVFQAVQSQLGNASAISGSFSLAGKWILGVLVSSAVVVSAILFIPNEELVPQKNEVVIAPAEDLASKQNAQEDQSIKPSINGTKVSEENRLVEVETKGQVITPPISKTTGEKSTATVANGSEINTIPPPVNSRTGNNDPAQGNGASLPVINGNKAEPVFAFAQKDTLVCWGLSYETYLLFGDNCVYDVYINGEQIRKGINGNERFKYQASQPGVYLIDWVVRRNERVWKKSQILVLHPLPEIKLSVVDRGNGRYVFVNEGIDKTSWHLDGQPNGKSAIQLYDAQPTDHLVQALAVSNAGCTDSAKLSFRNNFIFDVKELVFPNIFTPNGDGRNDFFQVEIEGATHFHMRILNYDGQVVFESTDPNAKWDGADKYKGNQVLQGTYTCFVEYALAGGNIKKEMKVIHLRID